MKALQLLILGLFVAFSFACSESKSKTGDQDETEQQDSTAETGSDIPEAVTAALQAAYPDAADVEWESEGEYYEAEWNVDGKEFEVVFDKDGKVMMTESAIDVSELPEGVAAYLAENHEGQEPSEVEKVIKGDEVFYEVEFEVEGEEMELLFDSDGNVLENGEEEEGEGEEDDD